jgi:PAS domain S-box-containing protein
MKLNFSRSYLALFLAALLPIILFASAIAVIIGFREQAALATTALAKVREITAGIDQYVAAQREAAEVMAQTGALGRNDLATFYEFAARLKSAEPGWSTVVVSDRSGRQLINLERPFGAPLAGPSDPASFARVLAQRATVIGDLAEPGNISGKIFVPIRAPVFDGDDIKYVVTIALDPTRLTVLFALADAPADWVGAVVDRQGNLLARSVLADRYVGQKANAAALNAIKQRREGIYEGRTLDGLDTAFAFYTSPLTGWSVHLALPKATYIAPLRRILWIVALCAVVALAAASILFTLISRESARAQAEQAQRERESQFRIFAQAMPNHVWTSPPSGLLDWFNEQTYKYCGAKIGELDGEGWVRIVHPGDVPAAKEKWVASLSSGKPYQTEFRLRRADGIFRWHVARALPIYGEGGEITRWIGTNTDIEDQKNTAAALEHLNQTLEQRVQERSDELLKTQEALRQSQKMEALGNLTGGIAHDFNNLLQIISGNLQLLSRAVAGNDKAELRAQNAMSGVSRAAKLTSQLLSFGRRQPLAPKIVNIGRLVRNLDDLLRRTLGEEIEIETVIAGGLWNTLIDPGNMENAIVNLAINARDAMDGKGKLTIEAGNAYLDEEYAKSNADAAPGQYVLLAVTDTGRGIPAEVIHDVFEPFFTTQPEGKGSGLGLSMVYGFVKQSKGHIKIYSELGQGTTVKLYLPRSLLAEDVPVPMDKRPIGGGSESILVVEDDDEVRDTAVATLQELGYSVLTAKDAQSALSVVESGLPIDLLFTDVVMPGPLRSTELARETQTRLPKIAILFTSGYTENAIVHGGRLDPGVELLPKPYTREALAHKVRSVLEKKS